MIWPNNHLFSSFWFWLQEPLRLTSCTRSLRYWELQAKMTGRRATNWPPTWPSDFQLLDLHICHRFAENYFKNYQLFNLGRVGLFLSKKSMVKSYQHKSVRYFLGPVFSVNLFCWIFQLLGLKSFWGDFSGHGFTVKYFLFNFSGPGFSVKYFLLKFLGPGFSVQYISFNFSGPGFTVKYFLLKFLGPGFSVFRQGCFVPVRASCMEPIMEKYSSRSSQTFLL